MFIEKTTVLHSLFKKGHTYILRSTVPARETTFASKIGILDGKEHGMLLHLSEIEGDGTHIFQEMLYDRDSSNIILDGYQPGYAINSRDLHIENFEDITDDDDFKNLLCSIEKNKADTDPIRNKVDHRNDMLGKTLACLTFLLSLAGIALSIMLAWKLCTPLGLMGIPLSVIGIMYGLAGLIDYNDIQCKFEPDVLTDRINKKENAVLETVYKKNDALLKEFEQKKNLETD